MTNRDVAKRADLIPQADTRDRVNSAHPTGTPTGMFAGETERDLRQEAETREVLEEALPDEPGSWKQSGAVPNDSQG
jgi:hypothetical protein